MNTSVINSSLLFNPSSSGSSLPLGETYTVCIQTLGEFSFDFVVKVINLVVGYPANIMVMLLVYRKNFDYSTSDIFIFNLAIADVCCCMMVPISLLGNFMLSIRNFYKFYHFVYGIKDASPLFLACICLDRYVAVVHPFFFTSNRENKIRVAISMLVWGFTLPSAVIRSLEFVEGNDIFAGLVLTSFAIMIFCNVSIMWSLRKSVFGKEKMHPMKTKGLRAVLIALTIIVCNYLPIVAVTNIIRHFHFPEVCQVRHIAFVFMDLSSSIEPLIYISKLDQLPFFNNLPTSAAEARPLSHIS